MSLQRRVLAYLAAAAIASCALTVGVAVVLVRHRIATQRMAQLVNQANVLAFAGGLPGALAAGVHVYRVGAHRPHRARPAIAGAVLAQIHGGGNRQGTIRVGRSSLLYVARLTASGRVVVFRGARLAFAEWRPFLISLALAGLGGALLAAALAYALARRLTRPIGALAHATGRLAAGETAVAVPISGGDELADLGRSFNAMSSELARARESQRAFLESVSHELKTPLTSVRGYAEALEEGAVDAPEGGRVIAAEADRLQRLVSDVLDLARLDRAGFAVDRVPVDLGAVGAAAVTRHLPRAHELAVTLAADHVDPAWGAGDEGRLLQATSNLIENALRLTPAGGTVTVRTRAREISVADTGPGLAGEDLPRAFERFYLHDRYRSRSAVGSGLGLAIVAELVTAMGGQVRAENRPEGGARFTIGLPATAPVRPPPPARSGARRPSA